MPQAPLHESKALSYLFSIAVFIFTAIAVGPSISRMRRRTKAVRSRAELLMGGREHLSAQEFASKFFASSQHDAATKIYELLGEELLIDVTRIHPDDRVYVDLGLGAVDCLDGPFLAHYLEAAFAADLRTILHDENLTVRQLIEAVGTSFTPAPETPRSACRP
jgi:hypothetical protein